MESRPTKKKPKRSLTRSFVVTVAVGVPGALAIAAGAAACSSTPTPENSAGPGLPPQPGVLTGKCTDEGAQQPCHFSLGKTMGGTVQSCFSGTQTCTGGRWGACGGDGTITNTSALAGLNVAPAGVGAGGLHTLALGAPVVCGDGVCSPLKCTSAGGNFGKACTVPGVGTDCGMGKTCGVAETFSTCALDCSPPAADGGVLTICSSDPCNPDCKGWQTNTPISSTTGAATTVIGVSGFGQIPGGQLNKLLLDQSHAGTKCDDFASYGLPSSYYNCQVDTYCQMTALGGDGNCHQFDATNQQQGTDVKGMASMNAGMDVTIGPGCSSTEADKYRYFPICNRGAVDIPVGTVIRVKYFNPVQNLAVCQNASCTAAAGFDCSMVVGDATSKDGSTATAGLPLKGGIAVPPLETKCQLLDTQQAGMGPGGGNCNQPTGERWMYANCDGATTGVLEGDVTMNALVATPNPANEPITAPGISGCANNWSDHAGTNNPPSCGLAGQNIVTFANDYHATCPIGFVPVWSKLNYDTTAASNASGSSEVFFEAATAPDVMGAPGVYSGFIELAESTDDLSGGFKKDPEKCSAIQPFVPPYAWASCTNDPDPLKFSPCCPKDIENQFKRSVLNVPFPGADPVPGAALARQEWLRLQITIKATPDNAKDVTLNSWSLSYQCIARE